MKKTIAFSGAVFFLMVLLSCSKNAKDSFPPPSSADRVITARVAPGETYVLDVALRGSLSISRQAVHHSISETGINEKNGYLTYKYIPAVGFTGTDEVMLAHQTEATSDDYSGCNYGGSHTRNNNSFISVKFTIAE